MVREFCPFHTLDDVAGRWAGEDAGWEFTCERQDHVPPGPSTWLSPPPPPADAEPSGIAAELGLAAEIPAVLKQFEGRWVEYGVFEHAYAISHPEDWADLMSRYSHTAVKGKRYTVSAFLGAALGNLSRHGAVCFHPGPATGRWSYNSTISWWSLPPEPEWSGRLSWEDSGLTVEYVPGQVETR